MKAILRAKFSIAVFAIILIYLLGNWFYTEKTTSFPEPEEAILNIDKNITLITGHKGKEEALFFLINNEDKLGALYIQEHFFGWKVGRGEIPFVKLEEMMDEEKITYNVHDDFLVYGLMKNADDYVIEVNGAEAEIISLEKLDKKAVEKYGFEDMYLWYHESEDVLTPGDITAYDKDTEEEVATVDLELPTRNE